MSNYSLYADVKFGCFCRKILFSFGLNFNIWLAAEYNIFIFIGVMSMQHRGERRGLGGIFFDDLNAYDQEMLLSFATGDFLESGP